MPIEILMPALSPTMTEGKLAKWLKAEGDAVKSGDVLAEIETDKATMEIEAVDEGVLGKILVTEGTEGVPVNQPIALMLEEGEDKSALEGHTASAPAAPAAPPAAPTPAPAPAAAPVATATPEPAPPPPVAASAAPAPPKANGEDRIVASPLARRMARQAGIELGGLHGSGPGGRIVKVDIEAALAGGAPAATGAALAAPLARPGAGLPSREGPGYREVPHSGVRKIVAKRLTEADREIPQFYMTIDCELDRLLAARKEINEAAPKDRETGEAAYKVSVNDFVIKAAALALRRVPAVNAQWGDEAMRMLDHVDVAVAVAYEGGLVTPIVFDADLKGLGQIGNEMKDLAGRGRKGKLLPEEYQGGSFSVSNLGMFGIRDFTAILNPPQACILAVGAGEARPVVRGGEVKVVTLMSCTLTCDHRVVDGALGAEFVNAFKGFIESPASMLA